MSKNITIQEGGVAKQLTVDKLKTNLTSSGMCLWVPEDEVQLTIKSITENGTYKASDDGYYGYEQVIVNVPGSGTATGTDGDGDEAVAHTDPTTGELVEDKVPSRLAVITPPTNPYGIYQDGQAISTNGMVVKAYLKTGGEYGTVPNGEITLNPTTASYDARTDTGGGSSATIDDPEYDKYHPPITSYGLVDCYAWNDPDNPQTYFNKSTSGGSAVCVPFVITGSSSGMTWCWFSLSPDTLTITTERTYASTGEKSISTNTRQLTSTSTTKKNGTTFYYVLGKVGSLGWAWEEVNMSPNRFDAFYVRDVATILFDGTSTPIQAGSHQQITVSWPRPLDGKVLETTFEILVAPPYSSGEE